MVCGVLVFMLFSSSYFLQLAGDSEVSNAGSLQLVTSPVGVLSLSSLRNGLESHIDPGDANRSVSQSDMTLHSKLEAAAAVQAGGWTPVSECVRERNPVCARTTAQTNLTRSSSCLFHSQLLACTHEAARID